VDPVFFGFRRALSILAIILRFATKMKHRLHIKKGVSNDECELCILTDPLFRYEGLKHLEKPLYSQAPPVRVLTSPYDERNAWRYLCSVASDEAREHLTPRKLREYKDTGSGIIYSGGRLSFTDLSQDYSEPQLYKDISFVCPVALVNSALTYSLCMYVHWEVLNHPGIERQVSHILKILHVERLRPLVKRIRETCNRCRYLVKKSYPASTGNQTKYSLMKCPPFYACQIDTAGVFDAYDVKSRVTKKAYMLVQVCMTTSAVSINILEDLTTESIILALTRHASKFGWSKYLLPDNASSFKTLENLSVSFRDLQCKLWTNQRIICDFSTPGSHQEHGKVESRIKIVKDILLKTAELGKRHSFIQWESIAAGITSTMNNLPIAHRDSRDFHSDSFNFVCPNHFIIGRNTDRSLDGFVELDSSPTKMLNNVNKITDSMHQILGDHIHRFIPGRKVFSGQPPNVGDVCLFLVKESERSRNSKYKFGRIVENYVDGRENKVRIKYKNAEEVVFRETCRNSQDVVLINSLNDIEFNTREHYEAMALQRRFLLAHV
jgi:hypothetical protein